jgi:hypothetical protein
MLRFRLMSRLGLVEPLVRWQRSIDLGAPVPARSYRPDVKRAPRLVVRPR